jgi:ribosomal protein S30
LSKEETPRKNLLDKLKRVEKERSERARTCT